MSDVLRILVAPLFWLAAFSAIYGLHGLACSQHSDMLGLVGLQPARMFLVVSWLAAILIQIGLLAFLWRRPSQSSFVNRVAVILGVTSVIAMLWSLFPVMLLSDCA